MGVGALLIFLGVALFSARLVRPLAGVLGWPATRIGGAAGKLARDNARRNPQRTASTAAALMIGLALVTLVADARRRDHEHLPGAVDDVFTSDYAITAQNNFSPIPIAAGGAAAKAPGVEAVASDAQRRGAACSTRASSSRRSTPDAGEVITLDWQQGSQATFRRARRRRRVRRRRLRRGSRAHGRLADHGDRSLRRAPGAERDRASSSLRPAARPSAPYLLERDLRPFLRLAPEPLPFIQMRGGDSEANTKALEGGARRSSRTRRCRRATSSSTTRSPGSTRFSTSSTVPNIQIRRAEHPGELCFCHRAFARPRPQGIHRDPAALRTKADAIFRPPVARPRSAGERGGAEGAAALTGTRAATGAAGRGRC